MACEVSLEFVGGWRRFAYRIDAEEADRRQSGFSGPRRWPLRKRTTRSASAGRRAPLRRKGQPPVRNPTTLIARPRPRSTSTPSKSACADSGFPVAGAIGASLTRIERRSADRRKGSGPVASRVRRERRANQQAHAEGEARHHQRSASRVKSDEALRSLHLSAPDAGRHRGAIPGQARTISSGHLSPVPKATKPRIAAPFAGLPLEWNIGV
jgi:hypothetical protein